VDERPESRIACADSGAEVHIFNSKDIFIGGSYKLFDRIRPPPIDLLTADSHKMSIKGQGDVNKYIQDAFHVPSSQNLISLPILRKNNMWTYILPEDVSPEISMLIFDKEGYLIMVADDDGNINLDFKCPAFQTLLQNFSPLLEKISRAGREQN
jgi:hypothetical protein